MKTRQQLPLRRTYYAAYSCVLFAFVSLIAACEVPDRETDLSATTTRGQVELREVWSLDEGLDWPESALYDADRGLIYVSNIGGDPSAKDGNGYISTVSPEGDILEEQWATGMNAPKGLALDGGTLYVSDIDELVAIDTETGEITGRYPAEGAQFLNDVAAANGVVYVTDSGTGRIHRLEGDSFTVWVDDPRIQSPNGIYVVDGAIVVAAADSSAAEPGQERYLWTISPDGTELEPLGGTTPLGGLDAVEPDGQGGFFLSDWGGAVVMHFTPGDSARTLVEVSQGTADFDYVAESGMLYLPVMVAGRLIAYEAIWGSESNGMQ